MGVWCLSRENGWNGISCQTLNLSNLFFFNLKVDYFRQFSDSSSLIS